MRSSPSSEPAGRRGAVAYPSRWPTWSPDAGEDARAPREDRRWRASAAEDLHIPGLCDPDRRELHLRYQIGMERHGTAARGRTWRRTRSCAPRTARPRGPQKARPSSMRRFLQTFGLRLLAVVIPGAPLSLCPRLVSSGPLGRQTFGLCWTACPRPTQRWESRPRGDGTPCIGVPSPHGQSQLRHGGHPHTGLEATPAVAGAVPMCEDVGYTPSVPSRSSAMTGSSRPRSSRGSCT
jgi:hypothetical protein